MEKFNLESVENMMNDDLLYKLPKDAEMLIEDGLYVHSIKEDDMLSFIFLNFAQSNMDGSNVVCSVLMHGYGFLQLGECRHTYWGKDGYIFYLNGKHMKAVIQWLEDKGFDLE